MEPLESKPVIWIEDNLDLNDDDDEGVVQIHYEVSPNTIINKQYEPPIPSLSTPQPEPLSPENLPAPSFLSPNIQPLSDAPQTLSSINISSTASSTQSLPSHSTSLDALEEFLCDTSDLIPSDMSSIPIPPTCPSTQIPSISAPYPFAPTHTSHTFAPVSNTFPTAPHLSPTSATSTSHPSYLPHSPSISYTSPPHTPIPSPYTMTTQTTTSSSAPGLSSLNQPREDTIAAKKGKAKTRPTEQSHRHAKKQKRITRSEKGAFEENQMARATKAINGASAILVTAGNLLSCDSGIPNYTNKRDWNKRFPHLIEVNFDYDDAWDSSLFNEKDLPCYCWTFWWDVIATCRGADPEEGFRVLKQICESKLSKLGYFIYTDAFDGMFTKAGFPEERLLEYRGNINYVQQSADCCELDVWEERIVLVKDENFGKLITADQIPVCRCEKEKEREREKEREKEKAKARETGKETDKEGDPEKEQARGGEKGMEQEKENAQESDIEIEKEERKEKEKQQQIDLDEELARELEKEIDLEVEKEKEREENQKQKQMMKMRS